MSEKPKMYVIKKFIMAKNCKDAIKKDKTTEPHDCFVDSAWADSNNNLAEAIGFEIYK